jgi:hypothetical protein
MGQHANDVRKKKLFNANSDSFATHFADQMRNFSQFSTNLHRNMLTCSIIWQANPMLPLNPLEPTTVFSVPESVLKFLRSTATNPIS